MPFHDRDLARNTLNFSTPSGRTCLAKDRSPQFHRREILVQWGEPSDYIISLEHITPSRDQAQQGY